MQIDHEVQLGILKQLLFHPQARFTQLNEFKLDNNHFNFHLKRLIEEGVVEKSGELYQLTPVGLELAGRMDIKALNIVRQPKVGVSILVVGDDKRILLGKRLRDPGMGINNFYTRKVKFGESVYKTAELCLLEETGLRAEFSYVGTIRFLQHQDRVMLCFIAKPNGGELIEKTLESENEWYTLREVEQLENVFPEFNSVLEKHLDGKLFFEEIN